MPRFFITMLALIATLLNAACTIQLAPAYDRALVEGIRDANNDIMQLYATTGMGVDQKSFGQRVDQYNKVIGKVDALALQSQSRPVPDSAVQNKVDQALKQWTDGNVPPLGSAGDDALAMAARECAAVRHVPSVPVLMTQQPPAVQVNSQPLIPASASALTQISRALRLMRDTDCAHGLNNGEVLANKGMTQYYISEALYYENFLQR
jgi:hypothetical protein